MSETAVDLDVLWAIVTNEPVLLQAEEFLTNVGEVDLSSTLNKLQQDVALRLKDHMDDLPSANLPPSPELKGIEHFLSDADPNNLYDTPVLMAAYETLTYDRFSVLGDVSASLEMHGAPFRADYDAVLEDYKKAIPKEHRPPLSLTGPEPSGP